MIITSFVDIFVIWGVSKWIIRAVSKEIGKMFLRKKDPSIPVPEKEGWSLHWK